MVTAAANIKLVQNCIFAGVNKRAGNPTMNVALTTIYVHTSFKDIETYA
jgi:hypothetical protein